MYVPCLPSQNIVALISLSTGILTRVTTTNPIIKQIQAYSALSVPFPFKFMRVMDSLCLTCIFAANKLFRPGCKEQQPIEATNQQGAR